MWTSNRMWLAPLILLALLAVRAAPVSAQPGHEGHAHAQPPAAEAAPVAPGEPTPGEAEGDKKGFENSRMAALFFWVLAGLTLGGALFVITRRNLISAVMGMVGTFFALAGLYAMLYAHFLAAIQVLVYAGAIMVLFVFVVMILNRPEDEPWAIQGLFGKALAGLAILYLVARLSGILWDIKDTPHAVEAGPQPPPVRVAETAGAHMNPREAFAPGTGPENERTDAFGSTRAVGKVLFNQYLFPFEAVSLVLLVAVVGGIAVARPHHREEDQRPTVAA
jgi:NADH-quinone oxidoreductase subunit J